MHTTSAYPSGPLTLSTLGDAALQGTDQRAFLELQQINNGIRRLSDSKRLFRVIAAAVATGLLRGAIVLYVGDNLVTLAVVAFAGDTEATSLAVGGLAISLATLVVWGIVELLVRVLI